MKVDNLTVGDKNLHCMRIDLSFTIYAFGVSFIASSNSYSSGYAIISISSYASFCKKK